MTRHFGSIRFDYKPVIESSRGPGNPLLSLRLAWFAGGLLVPIVAILVILARPATPVGEPAPVPLAAEEHRAQVQTAIASPLRFGGVAPEDFASGAITLPRTLEWDDLLAGAHEGAADISTDAARDVLELEVGRGDTLERLFRRHDLSIADMFSIVNTENAGRHLSLLRPGDVITIEHEEGRVLALSREIDEVRVLHIEHNGEGYHAEIGEREITRRLATAHAVVQSSLFNAGRAAGLSDALTMTVASLFQWDIDFALEIRQGDEFTVVYEERWRDGERLSDGPIQAAEFINRGRRHRVVRFEMDGRADYFTPEGESIRQAFIRAPVDFTRISSNFNLNRRHPVLNTIRAHRGVDYAAPTGTPIRAAGDGRVSFRGVSGGYGNTIILEHGGNITTLYAHISRFHPDIRVGSRVRQGQVIAYVGSTGLATGPHLHYEYRVNGVHRNPRTVELPRAEPVPASQRAHFRREVEPLLAELSAARDELMLALSDHHAED